MSRRAHPVDSAGLVLPDGSWPDQPGDAGALEAVRRFCNTINRENGADAWRTTGELDAWLAAEGYQVRPARRADLRRMKAVREALWECVRSGDRGAISAVAPLLHIRSEARDGVLQLAPEGHSVEAVVTDLVLGIITADQFGTFGRLKSCDHCRWVFYDASRNRTGRWCSMQACGGREKAKAYRRRHPTPRAAVPGRAR